MKFINSLIKNIGKSDYVVYSPMDNGFINDYSIVDLKDAELFYYDEAVKVKDYLDNPDNWLNPDLYIDNYEECIIMTYDDAYNLYVDGLI